jgi:hypothetical protein
MKSPFERFTADIGVPLGPLTRALFDSASDVEVHSPDPIGTIYQGMPRWGCDLYIDFPEPFRYITPTNVVPFGSTGHDCNMFGFVKPRAAATTTDALVVCLHSPKGGENLLVPNLAAFLSLVAIAGAEAISAHKTDEAYRESREEALADADFRRASSVLCSLPGVAIPSRPSEIIRGCPEVELFFEKEPPGVVSLHEARRLLDQGKRASAGEVVVLLVQKFVDLGDLVPRANWEALGELVRALRPALTDGNRAALRERGIDTQR